MAHISKSQLIAFQLCVQRQITLPLGAPSHGINSASDKIQARQPESSSETTNSDRPTKGTEKDVPYKQDGRDASTSAVMARALSLALTPAAIVTNRQWYTNAFQFFSILPIYASRQLLQQCFDC